MKEQTDWWDEIGEEQQKAIDKSMVEMKAGSLTTDAAIIKKYKK